MSIHATLNRLLCYYQNLYLVFHSRIGINIHAAACILVDIIMQQEGKVHIQHLAIQEKDLPSIHVMLFIVQMRLFQNKVSLEPYICILTQYSKQVTYCGNTTNSHKGPIVSVHVAIIITMPVSAFPHYTTIAFDMHGSPWEPCITMET